jgi:asparagine synthetase B (glutamine-hydrolysing)
MTSSPEPDAPAYGFLLRHEHTTGSFSYALGRGGSAASDEATGVTALAAGLETAETALAGYLRTGRLRSPATRSALAVHDPRERRVVLARDRTGVHPLFHLDPAADELVASTDGRLLQRGIAPSRLAVAAWLVGAPLEPARTLLESLCRVPAGHLLTVEGGRSELVRDWRPPAAGELPASEASRFGEALEEAVEPFAGAGRLAVFLSGGLDSSSVAAAAAAASGRAGREPPLALTIDMEGASEAELQALVAGQLGLAQLGGRAAWQPGTLERALERVAGELWPVASAWAGPFDDLGVRALEEGARFLLDGQGGDDLLDAGLAAGRELLPHPVAFAHWLRAQGRYTSGARQSLRAVAGSFRPRQPPVLPAWLPADEELRSELVERLATRPRRFAEIREADLLDPVLSAQREATFDYGLRLGAEHVHPLWSAGVVELLDGLPPAALVAGGNPKSPARAYLTSRLPRPHGVWPRPAVADTLFRAILGETEALLEARDDLSPLQTLDLVDTSEGLDFRGGEIWSMLCTGGWLRARGEVE